MQYIVTVFHYTDPSEAGESSSRIGKHLDVFENFEPPSDWVSEWVNE